MVIIRFNQDEEIEDLGSSPIVSRSQSVHKEYQIFFVVVYSELYEKLMFEFDFALQEKIFCPLVYII